MRVWTKAVFDMATMELIESESESFEYQGPVAECKKGHDYPAAPDPYATANAQTGVNRDAANYNAALNRINTYTPLGSQEYSVTGTDPTTGSPIYRQDINLSPQAQQLYDQQTQQNLSLGNVAQNMLGQVQQGYGNPMDTSGLPQRGNLNTANLPALPTDVEGMRKGAQDALYARNTEYLDPQFQRGEESRRTRLANQGVVEGSEAYKNAMSDFGQGRETAYRQARNESIAGAGTEAERLFGLGSKARGQLYGEQLTGANFANQNRTQALEESYALRNQPLNEFNALRSASPVDMPSFQGPASVMTNPADLMGAIYGSNAIGQNQATRMQSSQDAFLSALFGLGGSLGSAALMGR